MTPARKRGQHGQVHVVPVLPAAETLRVNHQRDIGHGVGWIAEIRRRHAHNAVGLAVQHERVRPSAFRSLPNCDRHIPYVSTTLSRSSAVEAADGGRCGKDREELGRHRLAQHPYCLSVRFIGPDADFGSGNGRENIAETLDVLKICSGRRRVLHMQAVDMDTRRHHAIGVRHAKFIEQHGLQDAQDCGIGADSEGNREHRREAQ